MTKSQYKQILSPLNVGALELRNRIIFGAHPTNFAKQNLLSEQHAAYYRERAKGGAGMIVLEEQLVHPSDLPYEKAPFGYIDAAVSGYRLVSQAVRQYGTVVVAQLNHSGMQSEGSTSMRELWAPSAVPDVVSREVPKAMEEADIRAVIDGFAKTAAHTAEGGLDGVEINAAQFSLVRQFMSPLTNQRSDLYGGELTNRLRFCKEILQAVGKVLGKDKIIGLRLCGDEFAPWGGLSPEDAVAIAQELEQLNILDYITVAVGSLFSLHLSWATYYSEPGQAVEAAARIKQAVKLPVFAEGRIHRPAYAARIIDEGRVDGVCMNRALICDPELPVKLQRNQDNRIMECLSCNQGCQVRRSMGKPLSCIINPLVGVEAKEEKYQEIRIASPKNVLVIGGGPAGIEAARIAAIRGHQVTLWESAPDLGGAMAASAYIGEISRMLEGWKRELKLCGVKVFTGKKGNPEDILAAQPDTLIVATGSKTVGAGIPVKGCKQVSARGVMDGPVDSDKTVLFWDVIGDRLAARAAEKLLAGGNKIYFVTPDWFAGSRLADTMELSSWNQRLMSGPAEIFTISVLKEIDGDKAFIENKFSGKPLTLTGIDLFVFNCWPKPDDGLYLSLKDRVNEIYRVGDCLAPVGIGPAVRQGYLVGRTI